MSASVAACCAAHPRSRGENQQTPRRRVRPGGSSPLARGKLEVRGLFPPDAGSSPLARGKPVISTTVSSVAGLIPARAGKTSPWPGQRGQRRAHPRSRGENGRERSFGGLGSGSSPLARGKPASGPCLVGSSGLIPARAGKTAVSSSAPRASRAHPRSRGENVPTMVTDQAEAGSSPLARGKRCGATHGTARLRLIPARAGKTSRASS